MHEQNIDEFLKLLKDSINQNEDIHSVIAQENTEAGERLSDEALKQKLKERYTVDSTVEAERSEYDLDSELLEEMVVLHSQSDVTDTEEAPVLVAEIESASATEDRVTDAVKIAVAEISENEQNEQSEDLENSEPVIYENAESDIAPWEDSDESQSVEIEPQSTDSDLLVEQEKTDAVTENQENEEYLGVTPASVLAEAELDYESSLEDIEDFSDTEGINELFAVIEEALTDDPSISEEAAYESSSATCVSDSIMDLMTQLGCEEELEAVSEEDISSEFFEQTEETDESADSEQESFHSVTYRRYHIWALLKMIALGLLSVVVCLYETLPLFSVEFFGVADYDAYPGAYILIGMQFMILGAVIVGKPMLCGLQRLCSLHPNVYSLVALSCIMTLIYDFAMVFSMSEMVPPMFHLMCVVLMLGLSVGEYTILRREIKVRALLSDDGAFYTLRSDIGPHSVTKKLYEGGLSPDKTVYTPTEASVSRSVCSHLKRDKEENGSVLLTVMMWSALLLSLVIAIAGMILERTIDAVFLSLMSMLFTVLPIGALTATFLPLGISACRLRQRGTAVASYEAIQQYAKTDVMVFRDTHLFRSCDTKETGIVMYEPSQAFDVVGCLQLLYAKIGSPMQNIFEEIPSEYRFDQIRIRRIAKNGIEAIVDRKHILLVGDTAFMKRYGICFTPTNEEGGRASLCVSLNGKMSAKIYAKYDVEPIFEMLVERLAQEGVECVVETYDPMIHAAFVSSARKIGNTSIAVAHKNAEDFRYESRKKPEKIRDGGVLVQSSRLKLAEAVVWCKRMNSMQKRNTVMMAIFGVIGMLMIGLLFALGWITDINQYWILLFNLTTGGLIALNAFLCFPKKRYFTVESIEQEITLKQRKAEQLIKKQKNKLGKKRMYE